MLRTAAALARALVANPKRVVCNWMALPHYVRNAIAWNSQNTDPVFRVRIGEMLFCAADRYRDAGAVDIHYFRQDLWAAAKVFGSGATHHVDMGSRVDGFLSHLLVFCSVTYVDWRPLPICHPNLTAVRGDALRLPFRTNSVKSLSSLHVIEHIGVGRYGDPVDPQGLVKAARELVRVLAPGGLLLVSVPVGVPRLVYDAHRVSDPVAIRHLFGQCELVEFSVIPDGRREVVTDASLTEASRYQYACGMFEFRKPA